MADKKKSLESAVADAEIIPSSSHRPRSSELMGRKISPSQGMQYLDQSQAAHDADREEIDANFNASLDRIGRREKARSYSKGGAVKSYCKGGKVIKSWSK